MSSKKTIRFTILASALALAAAAPAAFADSGTWYQGIHADPGGTPDAPAARHTEQVMKEKLTAYGAVPDAGTTYRGIHTDPGGTADAPAGRHTQVVMQKKAAPIALSLIPLQLPGVPNY